MTDINARRRPEVVLQLSDLHFGADRTAVGIADREIVLRSLLESVRGIEPEWKPSIVATTGDIGWAGRKTDYDAASAWFASLSQELGIPRTDFFFAPGNHDVERGFARTLARPTDYEAADRIFENGVPEHYQKPFAAYVEFCSSFGARPYSFRGAPSYLIGATTLRDKRFVCVNTCWFSQGDDDEHQLRLSLALMKLLEGDHALLQPRSWNARPITVALMHHPQDWLHHDERSHWGAHGQGSFLHLAARAHLLLCGHTHETPREHGRVTGGGIDLRCGASFANAGHPNTYQLIRFRQEQIEYRQFEFDNRPTARSWRSSRVSSARFSDAGSDEESEDDRIASVCIEELRGRLARYAADYVEAKSRALTPEVRPKLHPLHVEVHVARRLHPQRPSYVVDERTSLESLLSVAPRLVIWGDLGTGKSTIVGMFAESTNRVGTATVLLVPAVHMVPPPTTGLEALERVSRFVHSSLFPELDAFDVRESVLSSVDDTILIVDGLDEVDDRSARKILGALENLSESWPRLRVVATSRAVTHDYRLSPNWRSATIATLRADERQDLLTEVGVARGLSSTDARAQARAVLARVDADEVLKEAASSPLSLRLLYSEFDQSKAPRDRSLGEILDRLLVERLTRWQDADENKGSPTQAFCEAVPGAEARREVLSQLATAIHDDGPVSLRRAETLIRESLPLSGASEAAKAQALAFFQWANVIRVAADQVDFALRPLLEIACVPTVLARLLQGESIPGPRWRVVAFAAARARESGRLERLREALLGYISTNDDGDGWFVAACYIASESRDSYIANAVIASRQQRHFERPLYSISAERQTSATVVAMTIQLAGDDGFEWFYRSYLDPRYPILHWGSGILERIFEAWVSLQGEPTPKQAALLQQLPPSHLLTHSPALHKLVPLAVLASPGSMPAGQQAWLLARLFTHSSLSSRSELRVRHLLLDHKDEVRASLWHHVTIGYENSAKCALLWLESAPAGQLPPLPIVTAAVRSRTNWEGRFIAPSLCEQMIERLGLARWERLCRWHLSDPDAHIAVGAALQLMERTPEIAGDLRELFLKALHDGNRVPEVEPLLGQLAHENPRDVGHWLGRRIAEAPKTGLRHAASSWWRVFLSLLPDVGDEGPSCLASAVGGLGAFTLARHPDIRGLVRHMARGDHAQSYREALGEKLRRGTAGQRYGAAQLLICMGDLLGEALLACARARSDILSHTQEWDAYCLSLRFPAAAIDHLLARKDVLQKDAKLFVLALASAEGRELDDADVAFVTQNADRLHGMPLLAEIPFKREVFRQLLRLVQDQQIRVAMTAAAVLVQGHSARLDAPTRLRCELFTTGLGVVGRFQTFERDSSERDVVLKCGREMAMQYGETFVLGLLAEAATDPTKWRDAMRQLLRNECLPNEYEVAAWELFRIGNEFPHHGKAIGAAARKLFEEQFQGGRTLGEALWLVLLAHEFGAIQTDELPDVVNPYRGELHLTSIHAALATRMSATPPAFELPTSPPSTFAVATMDEVGDAAGGDDLARVCSVIARALYREPEAAEIERLAARGAIPRFVAAIWQYLTGTPIEPEWLAKIIGTNLFRLRTEEKCDLRLRDLFGQAFRRLVREQPQQTRALLGRTIAQDETHCLDAGMLVMSMGGEFAVDELASLLVRYSEIPYLGWRGLLGILSVRILRALEQEPFNEPLRSAISKAMEQIAAKDAGSEKDPLAMVVCACLAWVAGVEIPAANELFYGGIVRMARDESKKQGGIDGLTGVVELLKRVEPHRIREALLNSEEERPELVAIAILLSSFMPSSETLRRDN